jgi:hypothetical protein
MSDDYQREYDEAAAKLEAAANGETVATTAPEAQPAAPAAAAPVAEALEPAKQPDAEPKAETAEELRARLEKAEKALKDTQAWGTKKAQELARIQREQALAQREATKPEILAQQPELEAAIRHVVSDPTPMIQADEARESWMATIERAHPGIFNADADPELVNAILARKGEADWSDPIVAIAEITAEKLAHAERQIGKRFAAEAAKLQQKSAMSVPSASAGPVVTQPADKQLEEVRRIQNMSDADFAAEVRRVKGY